MQAGHYSSLLPDLFRHKNTKVRLFQPQVILLDFHGTISERRWEDKVIYPYVRRSIRQFIRDNFASETVQRCLPGLRNESFEQRFRNKYDDAPIIEDLIENLPTREGEEDDVYQHQRQQMADQVGEFLLWQVQTKRASRETQIIERLVWMDGFRRHQITTPIYDDTLACLQDWRERKNISLYVISSIDSETLKLLFENTDKGDLHQYLSGYVSSKRAGDKLISDTYRRFYDKTIVNHRNQSSGNSMSSRAHGNNHVGVKSPSGHHQDSCNGRSKSPTKSARATTGRVSGAPGSDAGQPRPILFLTDSGQEAKAASLVADGGAYDCLLVSRPGNRRIRTYYLSQFQYIEKFDDIEFVQQ